ncbi:hypothetical protein GY21_04060 [Cryobacterium roopkundense]|uniref:Gram-positive cocci surface proteins LPxTG domain-containing protein n=1 Tax=Cryobacterium roopkundense TaxID=1001240 RepID=A0A099JNH2_9MICO|nr:hypothetical protein [Cryobacterium roopkundense]KGJ79706.1 hypothetical protein GY21_04060 [Cryobacterium roopkundense]MBB5642694.1 hypothetical protein [Cryobacterium roopkundense]
MLAVAAAASVVIGGAMPAGAAPVDVLVSSDDEHFDTALHGGIFDDVGLLVPGGTVRSSLWIKNPSNTPAQLRVSARGVAFSSDVFADAVTVSTSGRGVAGSRASTLRSVQECEILLPAQIVAPGAIVTLSVAFTLDDMPGTTGQSESADLGLMVSMRDADAGSFRKVACTDEGLLISSTTGSVSTLATTGVGAPMALFAVAGLLLGIGGRLVAARRQRSGEAR